MVDIGEPSWRNTVGVGWDGVGWEVGTSVGVLAFRCEKPLKSRWSGR